MLCKRGNVSMAKSQKSKGADVGAELIKKYNFEPRPILHDSIQSKSDVLRADFEYGGLNPLDSTFSPLRLDDQVSLHVILDHITAAVEAGLVDKNSWSSQLFASAEDLDLFLEHLGDYDECYRITDRWWTALAQLANMVDEEGFITCQDIADKLGDSISEGAQRKASKIAEAAYFAKTPEVLVTLTEDEERALSAYNMSVRRKGYEKSLGTDISLGFQFRQPILYIQDEKVFARAVTQAEARKILKQRIAKATAKTADKARTKAPAKRKVAVAA